MSETNVMDRIKKDVEENPVLLFVKGSRETPMCGFSKATMDVFDSLGVPYRTVDVLSDPGIRDGIKAFTNWPTIPQVFVKGQFIGGCDIVREMHASGELAKLVKG